MDNEDESNGGTLFALIVLIFIGVFVYNHWLKPDKWQLMYEDSAVAIHVEGQYDDKNSCVDRISVLRATDKVTSSGRFNYECGSNCKTPNTPLGAYVCKDTAQ